MTTPPDPTTPKRTTKKGRSPSYPGIALDVAVERARDLYGRERRNPAPMTALMEDWGYAKRSGPGLVTLAALRKFGLIEYVEPVGGKGERLHKLTDLAVEILLNPNPATALKRAALEPSIHSELWAEYGADLPSDNTLRYNLIAQRGFTEVGADEFIREWKRTIAVAQLGAPGSVDLDQDQSVPTEEEPVPASTPVASGQHPSPTIPPAIVGTTPGIQRSLTLPLLKGGWATLLLPPKVTEDDWNQLLRVLEAMKPGLIETEVAEEPEL